MVLRIFYDLLEFWVPVAMMIMGGIVIVLETSGGMRAKYGRYNDKNTGLRANLAWLLQESPAFLIPFGLCIYRRAYLFDILGRVNTNFLLACFFMVHYFNRLEEENSRFRTLLEINNLFNPLL